MLAEATVGLRIDAIITASRLRFLITPSQRDRVNTVRHNTHIRLDCGIEQVRLLHASSVSSISSVLLYFLSLLSLLLCVGRRQSLQSFVFHYSGRSKSCELVCTSRRVPLDLRSNKNRVRVERSQSRARPACSRDIDERMSFPSRRRDGQTQTGQVSTSCRRLRYFVVPLSSKVFCSLSSEPHSFSTLFCARRFRSWGLQSTCPHFKSSRLQRRRSKI